MHYWLTSNDGDISFHCSAENEHNAFEQLAKHYRYADWKAFSHDLVLRKHDFRVASVAVQGREYDEEGNRKRVKQEQDNIVLEAFKHLRRVGKG